MDTTLKQVGELLLDAVPTIVLLLLLYAIYQNLVRKPLLSECCRSVATVLKARLQKARADVAAAEARTQEYEQKLRDAAAGRFQGAGGTASAGAAVAGSGPGRGAHAGAGADSPGHARLLIRTWPPPVPGCRPTSAPGHRHYSHHSEACRISADCRWCAMKPEIF